MLQCCPELNHFIIVLQALLREFGTWEHLYAVALMIGADTMDELLV